MGLEKSKILPEDEERLKAEARKISIREAAVFSFSDGFGFRNVTPYALALGASNSVIGFLASIPALVGNFSQLFSNYFLERYSRKKIVSTFVFIQAFLWLFMILPGVIYLLTASSYSPIYLVGIYTLLVVAGSLAGPAWSSWMKDIVTDNMGYYFGRRNKIAGTIALSSMLVAGFALDYFKETKLFLVFFVLFFLSFLARSISAFFFSKQYEPELKHEKKHYFSFFQFVKKMPYNNFGRFVIFISVISFATAIASPFFAVYMLRERGFSYSAFFLIILASSLATLLSITLWGKFADKYGNIRTMKLLGVFISVIPILWIFSAFFSNLNSFFYLFLIESFSGVVWAGFNLSTSNFIYDAVSRPRMALCSSYFNFINGIGVFLGATLGGLVASLPFKIIGSSLFVIFIISGFLRLLFYFIFVSRLKEVREVKEFDVHKKILRFSPGKLFNIFNLRDAKPDSVG